ncbi:hypothetical protein [Aeromicrobium sp.]|uniref:hypothetical protein n=1 Tax=Aeromicrobium sp. TaxID=1871063 RepID=UPI0030C00DC2
MAMVQQPVPHLDRIDHSRVSAVLNEGRGRCHTDVIKRRQNLRPVQEDVIKVDMQVAADGEMERAVRTDIEPQGLNPTDVADLGSLWHRQRSGRDPIELAHGVIGMHPHAREESAPAPATQLALGDPEESSLADMKRVVPQSSGN